MRKGNRNSVMMRAIGPGALAAIVGVALLVGIASDPENESLAQAATEQLRIVKRIPQGGVTRFAWSPDGRLLAMAVAGGRPTYVIWDVTSGRKVGELGAPYGRVDGGPALSFAPDGRHLLVLPRDARQSTPTALALWNVETGAIDGTVTGPEGILNTAVYNYAIGGSRMAVLFRDRTIALYDTRSWELISSWLSEPSLAAWWSSMTLSAGGDVVAIAGGEGADYRGEPQGIILLYDAESGRLMREIRRAHQKSIELLAFLGTTGRLVSTTSRTTRLQNRVTQQMEEVLEDDPVRVWDINDGRMVASFAVNFGGAYSLVASPDGRFVGVAAGSRTADGVSRFHLWTVDPVGRHLSVGEASHYFTEAALSPDGRLAALSRTRDRGASVEVIIVETKLGIGN